RSFHANNNYAKSLPALAVGDVAGQESVVVFGVDGDGPCAGESFWRLHHFEFSRRSLLNHADGSIAAVGGHGRAQRRIKASAIDAVADGHARQNFAVFAVQYVHLLISTAGE